MRPPTTAPRALSGFERMALAAALALAALAPGSAGAQAPAADRPARPALPSGRTERYTELERELIDAQRELAQGRATQAIAHLERLHARYPNDGRVIVTLAEAYARGGEPLRAVEVLERQIARAGSRDADLWIHLAGAYHLAGRGEDATETLLAALRLEPDWLARLEDQLEIVTTDSTTGAEAMERLRRRAGERDAPTAWREALAHVLVLTGHFDQAVTLVADLDRTRGDGGHRLSEVAAAVARRGDPAVALAAFDSLLAHAPDPGVAEEAWFERGRLLERLERHAEALTAYETLAREYPQGPLAMQSRLRAAAIRRGPLHDVAGAREAYRRILADAPAGSRNRLAKASREEALLGLGECALLDGAFAEAESTFATLERESTQSSARERAAFERAELLFYSGRMADAEEAYYQITDHYPSGEWINDALGRALLIGEFGATAPLSLEAYAAVLYRQRVGAFEDALRLCREALRDTLNVEMRAHLRMEEIRITAHLARWSEVDAALALLLAQDPGNRVAPVALHFVAEQAEGVPERRQQAQELYEELILRYPDSLEARQARGRLQALRGLPEES